MTAARLRLIDQAKVDQAKVDQARIDQAKKATAKKSAPAATPAAPKSAAPKSAAPKSAAPKSAPRARAGKRAATVGDLMRSPAACAHAGDTLHQVAQLMWERDVGAVVIVDDGGAPLHMVTDRDVCIGAYTQGVALWQARVESLAPRPIVACSVDASVAQVRDAMEEHGVRRVAVVDAAGAVVGVVGLSDLLRESAMAAPKDRARGLTPAQLMQTLGAVYEDVAVPADRARPS